MKRGLLIFLIALSVTAFGQVQDPEQFFGFRLGDDYKLAGWDRLVTYYQTVADGSDMVHLENLGKTTEGRPFLLMAISSRENIQNLDEIKRQAKRFADPRGLNDAGAKSLSHNSKAMVLISCSLHATEVGSAQMMPELVYDLITKDTPEHREILENVVFLLVPSFNPDGLDMVKNWYDAYVDTEFEGSRMPWLYQLYTGHDNNRDALMLTQVESRYINQILYHDWHPQVYLDMHQMGNRGSRIFVPPYIDPLNPNVDPLIVWEIALFGESMALDLESADKSGVGTSHFFTGWWQGAFMMNGWWHNIVGLLTELASCKIATPIFQTKNDLRGGGRGFPSYQKMMNFPNPWPGGWWRLRDIVEYNYIAAKSVLQTAAVNKSKILYNRYLMGKRALEAAADPPYAFVIPPRQIDPGSMRKMIQVLLNGGVEVHRARSSFTADNIPYDSGSYVVKMEQPFRAYAKDLLEAQEYPDIRESAGGAPIRPYDVAGWTLPYQMGVRTFEVTNPFEVDLERVNRLDPAGTRLPRRTGWGYILSHQENTAAIVVNRLLQVGAEVYWLAASESINGQTVPAGAILVPAKETRHLQNVTRDLSVTVTTLRKKPKTEVYRLNPTRVGMYKPWTSSMHEGWSRWLLEQYEFPFTNIYNEEFRVGNLRDRYDVIYIPDLYADGIIEGREEGTVPPKFAEGIGAEGVTQLKKFVEAGGVLITMDSSSDLVIGEFGLPVANVLKDVDRKDFYCPGSILAMQYDNTHPVAYGMGREDVAFFARSPAFKIIPNFSVEAKAVAKYPKKQILKSGYLLGEGKIANRAAIVDIPMKQGHVILLGFRAINRTQAHATFKVFFNAIHFGGARKTTL